MNNTRKQKILDLHNWLDSFLLDEIKCSDDYCAPVSKGQFSELYELFQEIVDLKFEGNYEEQRAIKIKLTNTHIHEQDRFNLQFKLTDNFSAEDYNSCYRTALGNLQVATETLNVLQSRLTALLK